MRGTAKPSFLSLSLEELSRDGKESQAELRRLEYAAFHLYTGQFRQIYVPQQLND